MPEALWSAVLNPSAITGGDGVAPLVALAALVSLVTWAFMALVGRSLMLRSSNLAVALGCGFVPLSINVAASLVAWSQPSGTDVGGMLMFAALVLSIATLPVTFATSVFYAGLRRRRQASRSSPHRDRPCRC